jgi:hypothetical protein
MTDVPASRCPSLITRGVIQGAGCPPACQSGGGPVRAALQSALSRLRPLCPGRKLPVEFDLGGAMKLLVELVLCIFHPVAVVLMWINLATRTDLSTGSKLAWAIFGLIPLVPFLYVLTGGELF